MLLCSAKLFRHQLQQQLLEETDKAVTTCPAQKKPCQAKCIYPMFSSGLSAAHTCIFSTASISDQKVFHPQQKPGKSLATLAQTQKKMYLHQIQNKRKDVCGRILTTRAFYEPAFPPFLTCFFKKIPHMGS